MSVSAAALTLESYSLAPGKDGDLRYFVNIGGPRRETPAELDSGPPAWLVILPFINSLLRRDGAKETNGGLGEFARARHMR